MKEIEETFEKNGGEWKEKSIGELFYKRTMKGFPKKAENLEENPNGYHIFGQNIKYQYPQKVLLDREYLHIVDPMKPILAYTSSVGEIGMIKESFYRSGDNGAFQGLFPKFEKYNKNHILFFLTLLNKYFKDFGYSTSMANILDISIPVPYLDNQIDFTFMENFIAELKALRVAELHAYLQATKLSNYILSDDEQAALNAIETAKTQIFNVEDLFGKSTRGKRLKSADRISGDLPFVTAGEADTGISAFIGNNVERFRSNTITIDMFGSAKYRNYEYGADDHIAVVHTDNLPKHAVLFLTSAMHKVANAGQFSYARNFYAKDADALNIELPVKNGTPDFDLMENYLRAIEKLVIKDVVDWADRQIATTEQVI